MLPRRLRPFHVAFPYNDESISILFSIFHFLFFKPRRKKKKKESLPFSEAVASKPKAQVPLPHNPFNFLLPWNNFMSSSSSTITTTIHTNFHWFSSPISPFSIQLQLQVHRFLMISHLFSFLYLNDYTLPISDLWFLQFLLSTLPMQQFHCFRPFFQKIQKTLFIFS